MAATGRWEEEAGVSITDDGMGMMYNLNGLSTIHSTRIIRPAGKASVEFYRERCYRQ